jgi:hypothetical protein
MNNKNYDPIRNRVNLSSRTAYPELYDKTYWGGSAYKGTQAEDEICLNRCELAEKFGLQSLWTRYDIPHVLRMSRTDTSTEMDHVEAYLTTAGNVLLIVSNYGYPPPSILRIPEYSGKLYHTAATSYVRLWVSRAAFRKHIKAAMELTILEETADFPPNIRNVH